MSEQQLNKLIENHIKDLLFNKNASSDLQPPPGPSNIDSPFNLKSSLFHDKSFLCNDAEHKEKLASSMPLDCSLNKPPSSSQLIDLNVLTDFAAKHADISNDIISNSSGLLPHPELENDLLSNPGTSIMKDILLNCNSAEENKNLSKFPLFSESLPSKDMKNCDRERNFIDHEDSNNPDFASDKKKKIKKSRKQNMKEKANRRTAEKPFNQSAPSSNEESPRREIKVNKHSLLLKEVPVTPEKKADMLFHKLESGQHPGVPLPQEETEYTVILTKDGYKFVCNICNYESKVKDYITKHLNSDSHRELKKQIKADRVLPFLPEPLLSQVEVLTDLLMSVHATYGLNSEDMIIRENLTARLKQFIECNLTECSIDMIGSSVTGLGLKKSKVDISLRVADTQNIPDCLETLYKTLLEDPSFCNVESVFKKKKLGILFTDKETGLDCSIVLENALSDKYARLFSFYSELDPRVKILASCFRHWAELCSLDNQDRGTFPSITFPIMLVYFLQQIEPPVLPVLHEVKEYGNNDFAEKYVKAGVWKSENDLSVGELWLKLFYFYNFTYELGKHVVCVRSSSKILCSERNWSTRFYAIEDPFSRRNIAHVIPNFSVCHYIQQCFLRAYRYFAFPQIVNKEIKLITDEEFTNFLSSYAASKAAARDDSSDESGPSDNEDSSIPDEVSLLQDFEDHDPDIPIENAVLTLKSMVIDDNKDSVDEEVIEDSQDKHSSSHQGSVKAESPKKESKKNKDKSKTEEKIQVQGVCKWDLKGLHINKESFSYQFDPVIFKGGKKDVPFSCKLCKSSGHLKKNCPTEDRIPRPQLPEMTNDFLRVINKTLFYIRDKNCVDEADRVAMEKNMQEMESHIRKEFPEASLSMFGSFCNGFGFKNRSDMDFCLTFKGRFDSKDLDCTEVIENLAKHLRLFPKLDNIIPVTSAKVPIVKFAWKDTRMEGDISLYNTLALANTEMLELYSRLDVRVQVLGFALKYFAKVLGICDASRGSLSSYAYILMVIFFLQQRQPPVIPVLQELHDKEKPSRMVDGWNVWYFNDIDKLPIKKYKPKLDIAKYLCLEKDRTKDDCHGIINSQDILILYNQKMPYRAYRKVIKHSNDEQLPEIWPDYGKNKETCAELWLGLLSFYAYDFDWREYVVCIRQKALLTRFRKLWITDQIAIEDPFDLNHNLGAGLSRKMNMYIFRTFARGWERFGTALPIDKIMNIHGHEVLYLFDRRFLNSGSEPPHDRGCRSCGKIGHIAKNCTQEKTCLYCRMSGHYAKNCPRKKQKVKNKQDRNSHENFPFENSNIEQPNIVGHPLLAQNDMQRNNSVLNHMPINNEDSRKLLPMGFPAHRHPPPVFPKSFKGPPPGFPLLHGNNAKFNSRFPHPAPFPRSKPAADLSQSPPKHFGSSPPKGYAGNNMFLKEPPPPIGIRTGLLPDPHMPPPEPIHRMWQSSMPNRMAPQYMDRRKRTS